MSAQKVIAWRGVLSYFDGDTPHEWEDGEPSQSSVDYIESLGHRIEYAYTKAAPDPLLAQMAEALRWAISRIPEPVAESRLITTYGARWTESHAALSAYNERVKG